ncbi:class II fructose-bisphosphate aldolase [Streptomyces sp. NPDC003011]
MLLHGTDALKQAAAAGHALPGFVAHSLETVQGITAAAEAAGRPVLIQADAGPFRPASGTPR